jgi:hypothetical protein
MQKNQKIKTAEKMTKIYSFGYSEKSLTTIDIAYPINLFNEVHHISTANFSLLNASLINFLTPFFLRPLGNAWFLLDSQNNKQISIIVDVDDKNCLAESTVAMKFIKASGNPARSGSLPVHFSLGISS